METVAPQQEIGIIGRMLRIFYAPGETFEAVAQQRSTADWLAPAILSVAITVGSLVVISPVMSEFRQQALEQQMQNMPPEQREMMKSSQGMMEIGTLIAAPIMTFVVLFITSGIYLVLGRLLGGTLQYGQALTINAYAMMIAIPQQIIKTPLILAKGTPMIHMGLGLALSEEMLQTFGGRLLSSLVDPFAIWSIIVVGIGLSIVGQIERTKAYRGAALIAVGWLAIAAAMAGLGSPAG
jgi:hypothetical protein